MKKIVLFSVLIVIIIISAGIRLAYLSEETPNSGSEQSETNNSYHDSIIELYTYSGWKGVESMATPLDNYIKSMNGNNSDIYFSYFVWPLANSDNPFKDIIENGTGVVIITVLSIDNVTKSGIRADVVYQVKINKIIVDPQNTIEIPPQELCIKDPTVCELAQNQYQLINSLLSEIKENNTIKLKVTAFISENASNKTNLTIHDVASPFPLLEPGYEYIVFLDVELDGIYVHYDYVWGPWAYLIMDGQVFSLNTIKPPSNITLNPTELFQSPTIYWRPYTYDQLREIAIEKLSVYGESVENFVSMLLGG